jgi:hypothetical protein
MKSFRRWADLPPDFLCCIGDRLELKWYASARGVCTSWRRALVPPSPALLVIAKSDSCYPYAAASLPTGRSFELTAFISGWRCVGSSNGWLAFSVHETVYVLLNPIAAVQIILPPLNYGDEYNSHWDWWVSKIVFTPSTAKDDFAAAAICGIDRIAYITAGATRWAFMGVRLSGEVGDKLTDVVYTDKGKFYCLSMYGDVHVLRLPARRCRKPANAEEAGSSELKFSVLRPLPPARHSSIVSPLCWENYQMLLMSEDEVPPSQGRRLNPPATLKPLLPRFGPTTLFAPPYDTVRDFTSAKNLVFCDGNLYQVWRNESCTVTLRLPAGGQRRVAENEIVVLKYCPGRQPSWDVVKDLGGYSLFVGTNNAVSMYAEGVPGLRGNCVYWIGGRATRNKGMVFDMKSGRSTPCRAPQAGSLSGGHDYSTVCWYFMSDVINNSYNGRRQNVEE